MRLDVFKTFNLKKIEKRFVGKAKETTAANVFVW
jgi:hypothetical protein